MQFISFGTGKSGSATGVSGTINSYASMTGTAGNATVTTALSVSAGDQVLLHQSQGTGAGNWEVVYVITPGSGSFTTAKNLANSYGAGAQAVLLPQYSTGTISGALTATSWNGTIGGIITLLCNGALTISGSVTVNGGGGSSSYTDPSSPAGATVGGFRGGAGRHINSAGTSTQGESYGGAGGASQGANGVGGGGGTSNTNNAEPIQGGGGGGHATSGAQGTVNDGAKGTAGAGGGTGAQSNLQVMIFGGGGGGGNESGPTNSGKVTYGGCSGGGIILLIAKTIDISSGSLSVTGGSQSDLVTGFGMGGSGAGGSILIKAQSATLGTTRAVATGGASSVGIGGGGGQGSGGAGGDGRIHLDYKDSYSGSTNPTLDVAQDTSTFRTSVFTGMI